MLNKGVPISEIENLSQNASHYRKTCNFLSIHVAPNY